MPKLKIIKVSRNVSSKKPSSAHESSGCLLAKWNALVEDTSGQETLPPEIWDQWLWHTDPQASPTADLSLNHCQLLGLLIARYRASRQNAAVGAVPFRNPQLRITDKHICKMTLRELRDSLANVTLQWGTKVATDESPALALQFLDMCFHRFGEFSWLSWDEHAKDNPLADDISSIECVPVSDVKRQHRMTFACMRNMLNTFLILYRLLSWQTVSASVSPSSVTTESSETLTAQSEISIEKHHVQASLDIFYKLGMFYDLMPAARLNYMHNFSGLYNCISQPTYFHNPDYERRVQLSLDEIRSGKHDVNTLPALMQMFPEIVLLYEDDDIQAKMKAARIKLAAKPSSPHMWAWVMTAARAIYLLKWDSRDGTHKVFFNAKDPNILTLVKQFYLPWHEKHSQTVLMAKQQATSNSLSPLSMDASNNQQSLHRQNQIMTYFKLKFAKRL